MRKNKPSRTAYKVALNVITLGAVPEMEAVLPEGLVETTARMLVASGAASKRIVRWSGSPRMVKVYRWFDWMLPGQFEAFGYRKAFCERQVREGIAAGACQVLVLGAGYDTLGWRLAPEFPGVNFFEIDHPATATLKAKGVEKLGTRENLTLIAEDLGERKLVDVLKSEKAWDETKPTVFIAEGLLMYLPSDAVKDLFQQCSDISGAGSRIAFTYLSTREDGLPDAGQWTELTLWMLKWSGEPWQWSIRPEELDDFVSQHGWKVAPETAHTQEKKGVEFFEVAVK